MAIASIGGGGSTYRAYLEQVQQQRSRLASGVSQQDQGQSAVVSAGRIGSVGSVRGQAADRHQVEKTTNQPLQRSSTGGGGFSPTPGGIGSLLDTFI